MPIEGHDLHRCLERLPPSDRENVLRSTGRMAALLADLYPHESLDTNLLVAAMREGIVAEVSLASKRGELRATRARLFRDRLQSRAGLTREHAERAVALWAEILDVPTESRHARATNRGQKPETPAEARSTLNWLSSSIVVAVSISVLVGLSLWLLQRKPTATERPSDSQGLGQQSRATSRETPEGHEAPTLTDDEPTLEARAPSHEAEASVVTPAWFFLKRNLKRRVRPPRVLGLRPRRPHQRRRRNPRQTAQVARPPLPRSRVSHLDRWL